MEKVNLQTYPLVTASARPEFFSWGLNQANEHVVSAVTLRRVMELAVCIQDRRPGVYNDGDGADKTMIVLKK
jgi:hypothetical protein